METRDEYFMRRAIEQARQGQLLPGCAEIGCVIVCGDQIIAAGHNEVERKFDPTSHAEIVTLRKFGIATKTHEFRGATLYCTLQPCGMCTMASLWAKIDRIVYGAGRAEVHPMYFEERHFNTIDFVIDAFRDNIDVVGGVLAEECAQFYRRYDEYVPPAEMVNL